MTRVIQFVEIDVPHCALTYGTSPCQASLSSSPPTGTRKCFNSLATCQDRANFTDVPVTLRFGEDVFFRQDVRYDPGNSPRAIAGVGADLSNYDAFPFIKSVDYQPAIVSLGGDIGQRATIKVTFKDAPHPDNTDDFDKYPTE